MSESLGDKMRREQFKRTLFSWFNERVPDEWHDADIDRLVDLAIQRLQELLADELAKEDR